MKNIANGTGRRKTSVARVYLRSGKGNITINGRTIEDVFPLAELQSVVKAALNLTDTASKYDVLVTVRGGGINGQAEAVRHGMSRALASLSDENRKVLKANGFLTRDSRMVERKKFGQRGARRRFQFSKR
ncbi:30S ribosomal protein S9 [Spirochaeta cellobiosiphila]|uniref:30S ribosomal protein S9 n=1 Tax=Spirochaeta cellobiosiphila TaxID=504483 RepID=UPI00048E523F|nr:30S ribosomal protein S9 [Spirochaeta cellobiosiphila]